MITMAEPRPRRRRAQDAKKAKRGRPKSAEPPKDVLFSFRGTSEYGEWLDGLVEHCREQAGFDEISVTAIVGKALICLAKERGYEKEPPKR